MVNFQLVFVILIVINLERFYGLPLENDERESLPVGDTYVENSSVRKSAETMGNHYEGDIVIEDGKEQKSLEKINGIFEDNRRWKFNSYGYVAVPYKISDDYCKLIFL